MYRGPILWGTTFSYMYLCTEWMYFNSSLLIEESLQKEAMRSMAMKILITNSSLVNGTSNMTKCDGCVVELSIKLKSCVTFKSSKQKEIHACEKNICLYVFVVKKRINLFKFIVEDLTFG